MPERLELPPIKSTPSPSYAGPGKKPTSPEVRAVRLSNNITRVLVALVGLATAAVGGTALKKSVDTKEDVDLTRQDVDLVKAQVADHQQLVDHIAEEKASRKETKDKLDQLVGDQSEMKAMLKLELKKHGITEAP